MFCEGSKYGNAHIFRTADSREFPPQRIESPWRWPQAPSRRLLHSCLYRQYNSCKCCAGGNARRSESFVETSPTLSFQTLRLCMLYRERRTSVNNCGLYRNDMLYRERRTSVNNCGLYRNAMLYRERRTSVNNCGLYRNEPFKTQWLLFSTTRFHHHHHHHWHNNPF